ncbi:MAG: tetratricopeptide repeat protein [Phycisphaerae bacterium]|nr:tetratricopeptide repeat protein [Phycisphaerae bacterium]
MPGKRINWNVILVVIIGLTILVGTAIGLRQWQRSRNASEGLKYGTAAYEEGRWSEAASQLGRYVAIHQNDKEILLKYADALFQVRPRNNGIKGALNAYRKVLLLDKGNLQAATRVAEIYMMMNAPGEAELNIRKALAANDDPEIRHWLAVALVSQRLPEKVEDAITQLKTILKKNLQDKKAYQLLAGILVQQKKIEEATDQLKQIVSAHPDEINAYELLGQIADGQSPPPPQTAEYWFNLAVEKNPEAAQAYLARAFYHLKNNHSPQAQADLQQAQTKELSDFDVTLRLARGWIQVNELEKADKLLQGMDTEKPALWQMRIALAQRKKSSETPVDVVTAALEKLPATPRWDFLPYAIELLIETKSLEKAEACIEEIIQQDEMPAQVSLWQGLVAKQKEQYYKAIDHFEKAVKLGDKSVRTRLNLAETFSQVGDTLSSVQALRALVSQYPNDLNIRLSLARAMLQIGNDLEATEHVRQAFTMTPANPQEEMSRLQVQMQLLSRQGLAQNATILKNMQDQLTGIEKAGGDTTDVRQMKFQIALRKKDYATAQTLLAEWEKEDPASLNVAQNQVALLIARDEIDLAKEKLLAMTKTFPESMTPVRSLVAVYLRQEDSAGCEATLTQAIKRFKKPADHRTLAFMLTDLYLEMDKDLEKAPAARALTVLDELKNDLPRDIPVRRRLLTLRPVLEDGPKAQSLVDDIKSIEGEDGWQWRYEQAKIWLTREDFKENHSEIVALLKENLTANQADLPSRLLLATAYTRNEDYKLAALAYNDALPYSPNNINIMVAAVMANTQAGDIDQADQILERAQKLNIPHPELPRLELQKNFRRGNLSNAEKILEKFVKDNKSDQASRLSLATVKMRQGDNAEAEIRQEKYAEAAELIRALRAESPKLFPAAAVQVDLFMRQNKTQDALSCCDEIVQTFNDSPAYMLRANTLEIIGRIKDIGNEGHIERAEKDYAQAAKLTPDDISVFLGQCNFYTNQARPADAIMAIEKALALDPKNAEALKRATALYVQSEEAATVAKGRDLLRDALKIYPEDNDLNFQLANLFMADGTQPAINKATDILNDIVQREPRANRAWVRLIQLASQQRNYRNAVDLATMGLAHSRDNRELLLLKSQAEAMISPSSAETTLKKLHDLYKNDVDIAIRLANLYLTEGKNKEAISLLKSIEKTAETDAVKKSIKVGILAASYKEGDKANSIAQLEAMQKSAPDDPLPAMALMNLYADENNWEEATARANQWHQAHPKDTTTLLSFVNTLLTRKRDDHIETCVKDLLGRILEMDPENARAVQLLAVLEHSAGQSSQALQRYQKLLELQPDNVIAMNNLAWILCEQEKQYPQALKLTQTGLAKAPNYFDLVDTRGVIYYRMGQLEKAIIDFKTCIDLYPRSASGLPGCYFHLGRAQAQKNKPAEAMKNLTQALELNKKAGGQALTPSDISEIQKLLDDLMKTPAS